MSIFIAREATGGQSANNATETPNTYDTVVRNDASWPFDGTSVTVPAGYYLVAYQEEHETEVLNGGPHAAIEGFFKVGGTAVIGGKGGTNIRRLDNLQRGALSGVTVTSPGAEGTISTATRRVENLLTNLVVRRPNSCGMQVVRLADGLSYFRSSSRSGTFNNNGTWTARPFTTVGDIDTNVYANSVNTQLDILVPGTYYAFGHVRFYNSGSLVLRVGGVRLFDITNNVEVPGTRATTMIYRTGAGYNTAAISFMFTVPSAASFQLQVRNDGGQLSGTYLSVNEQAFGCIKVPDGTPLLQLRNSTAQDAETAQALVFDTQVSTGAPWTHVSGESGILVNTTDPYLFTTGWYSLRPTGNSEMMAPHVGLRIDGSSPGYGATSALSTGTYSSSAALRSGAMASIVAPVTSGQVLTLYNTPLGGTSDNNFQPDQTVLSAIPLYSIAEAPPVTSGPGKRQVIFF